MVVLFSIIPFPFLEYKHEFPARKIAWNAGQAAKNLVKYKVVYLSAV